MNPLRLLPFLALALVACNVPSAHNQAFSAAAKSVGRVQYVLAPGDESLPKAVATLGAWPADAEITTSRKVPTGTTQLAVGYDKNGTPVVAVVEDAGGKATVITDPDIISGYDRKARTLTGHSVASSVSSDSNSGSSAGSPGSPQPTHSGSVPKGSPVQIGDSMAEARKKIHGVDSISDEGTDHEIWTTTPLQAGTFTEDAMGSLTGGMGLFGSAGSSMGHKAIKSHTWVIHFEGGRVSSVTKFSQ